MIGKAVVPRDNFSYLDGRIDFCEYLKVSQIWVSENTGTPKSSILIGFSIIFTIHFGSNGLVDNLLSRCCCCLPPELKTSRFSLAALEGLGHLYWELPICPLLTCVFSSRSWPQDGTFRWSYGLLLRTGRGPLCSYCSHTSDSCCPADLSWAEVSSRLPSVTYRRCVFFFSKHCSCHRYAWSRHSCENVQYAQEDQISWRDHVLSPHRSQRLNSISCQKETAASSGVHVFFVLFKQWWFEQTPCFFRTAVARWQLSHCGFVWVISCWLLENLQTLKPAGAVTMWWVIHMMASIQSSFRPYDCFRSCSSCEKKDPANLT